MQFLKCDSCIDDCIQLKEIDKELQNKRGEGMMRFI